MSQAKVKVKQQIFFHFSLPYALICTQSYLFPMSKIGTELKGDQNTGLFHRLLVILRLIASWNNYKCFFAGSVN